MLFRPMVFVSFCLLVVCFHFASAANQTIENGGLVNANKTIQHDSLLQRVARFMGLEKVGKWAKDKVKGSDHDKDKSSSFSEPHRISGTDLRTRTYYKISMKKYRSGFLTWSSKKDPEHHDYRYVIIDDNRENAKDYRKGGERYKDTQWEFVPVSSDTGYHWFKLRNRGKPDEYLSFSRKEYVDEEVKSSYLVLDRKPDKRDKEDLLFKPITDLRDREYYQLKSKGNHDGLVVVSKKEHKADSFFLQVVNNRNERVREKYEADRKHYDDSLFVFETVKHDD